MSDNTIKVTTVHADGTVSHSSFEMPPELVAKLDADQKRYEDLKAAGTPYWCIHEGRSVTHEAAYWRDDEPDNKIHRKHGVFCRDCGGYIQEG